MRVKKYFLAIFFIIFILATNLLAQEPNVIWLRLYGGEGYESTYWVEEVSSMDNRGETGFIMVGCTHPFDAGYYNDIYLIKTDYRGIVEWERVYGDEYHDIGYCVRQTMDGGFIVCGGDWDIDTYKIDGFLMKTDAYGDTIWIESYGGQRDEALFEVCPLSDGGYIAAGFVEEPDGYHTNIYLVRTDANGNLLWSREYGQIGYIDHAESIQPAGDGGFVLCGWMNCVGTGYDVQFIKVDSQGDIEWTRYFGGDRYDQGFSVARTIDGGYVIAGHKTVDDLNNNYDFYLVKTSGDGFVEWERTYGGTGGDRAYSVRQTVDGGYIISGASESFNQGGNDIYVVKTDNAGNLEWHDIFGDYSDEIGECIRPLSDGNFVVTGHAETYGGAYHDAFLMKISPGQLGVEDEMVDLAPEKISLSQNYPNPFNAATTIELNISENAEVLVEIYNILGEKLSTLHDGWLPSGNHKINWRASGLPSGVYFYKIGANSYSISKKMLLLK